MIVRDILKNITRVIVFSVCLLGMLACSRAETDASVITEVGQESDLYRGEKINFPSNNLASTDKEKTTTLSYAKPGADVRLRDSRVIAIDAVVAAKIELELIAPYKDGKMIVELSGSEGLSLLGVTEQQFIFGHEARYQLPLHVLAQKDGRYYIHIRVVVEHEGRRDSRALSAIIQVGALVTPSKLSQKIPAVSRDADNNAAKGNHAQSDAVISLPARETIVP